MKEAPQPFAQEPRTGEVALPKRNPRRLRAEAARVNAKRDPDKSKPGEIAPPPAEAPAPPPVVMWSPDEVLEGRERCLVALARIEVDIDVAPPTRTGQCGMASPVVLRGLGNGKASVAVHPPALLNCEMVQAVHDWLEKTVQPAAREILGEDIIRLESVAGYQCRNRARTTRLSEHALANAIDILGFVTRSGQTIAVLDGWGPTQRDLAQPVPNTPPTEKLLPGEPPLPRPNPVRASKLIPVTSRAALRPSGAPARLEPSAPIEEFLKLVHERSCEIFKTVLGPEANEDHRNHFHLDLAQRQGGAHYCR